MGTLVLTGATSGSTTLQPTDATTQTITLPANSGTVVTTASSGAVTQNMLAAGVAGTGPAFSAYQSSAQTINWNTATKVQFQSEEFDTASCFDSATNYRFTPNVAGYYLFTANIGWSSATWADGAFYKNGSPVKSFDYSYSSNVSASTGTAFIYLNGTTDYVEVYLRWGNNPNGTLNATIQTTWFQGCLMRAA